MLRKNVPPLYSRSRSKRNTRVHKFPAVYLAYFSTLMIETLRFYEALVIFFQTMALHPTEQYFSESPLWYFKISCVQLHLKYFFRKSEDSVCATWYGATIGATQIYVCSKGIKRPKRQMKIERAHLETICTAPMHPFVISVEKCTRDFEIEHHSSLRAETNIIIRLQHFFPFLNKKL
jgi:hypothetical protein